MRGLLDDDHVGARDHHLAHDGVVELEDGVDELAVVLLEHLQLRGLVDHAEQLLLARERGDGLRPPGRHPVAEGDERVGDGPDRHADHAHEQRRPREQRAGVDAADGARARADEHERDGGHDRGGDQQRDPPLVDRRGQRERDEHRGAGLGDDPHEPEGVDARPGVGGDGEQRAAGARGGRELLDVRAGQRRDGGLGGGEQAAEDDQEERGRRRASIEAVSARARSWRTRSGCRAGDRTSRAPRRARRGRSPAGAGCRAP